jgi:Glycoside-hydrolase family GH114
MRSFDFAVVEQCFQYRARRAFLPFTRARKAVFEAEYSTPRRRSCPPCAAPALQRDLQARGAGRLPADLSRLVFV